MILNLSDQIKMSPSQVHPHDHHSHCQEVGVRKDRVLHPGLLSKRSLVRGDNNNNLALTAPADGTKTDTLTETLQL